jgi:Fe-S cluster assembly protein SufD
MDQKLAQLKNTKEILKPNQEILGLYVMKDNDVLTSNIKFINNQRDSFTRITLKFILLDNARLDLEATAVINNGASLTDTYLKIDCLLLSQNAKARIIPCMEIMEDNVKGGHGATIGMVDDLQKWYLTSRGITEEEAEKMLIQAFAQDIINKAESNELKSVFQIELDKLNK